MPSLLDSSNFSPLVRRLVTGASAGLATLALTACEHRHDARSLASGCVRSLSTLAPIMGGGSALCAATPAAAAADGPIVRMAAGPAMSPAGRDRALIASAH